jgi:hypothetical protein
MSPDWVRPNAAENGPITLKSHYRPKNGAVQGCNGRWRMASKKRVVGLCQRERRPTPICPCRGTVCLHRPLDRAGTESHQLNSLLTCLSWTADAVTAQEGPCRAVGSRRSGASMRRWKRRGHGPMVGRMLASYTDSPTRSPWLTFTSCLSIRQPDASLRTIPIFNDTSSQAMRQWTKNGLIGGGAPCPVRGLGSKTGAGGMQLPADVSPVAVWRGWSATSVVIPGFASRPCRLRGRTSTTLPRRRILSRSPTPCLPCGYSAPVQAAE